MCRLDKDEVEGEEEGQKEDEDDALEGKECQKGKEEEYTEDQ